MVITDLYHPDEEPRPTRGAPLPGIEYAGRYGTRTAVTQGWRAWLARSLGREDLVNVAPARIAAAVLPGGAPAAATAFSCWIATPLHLSAGLTHVHLDHRGLLRLPEPQLAALAAAFASTFAGSGSRSRRCLRGSFCCARPGIEVVATTDPERCAGGQIAAALPHGPQAAGLRRTAAEIEMWLHAQGAAGRATAEPTVNALWLWGGAGAMARCRRARSDPEASCLRRRRVPARSVALEGGRCQALPANLASLPQGDGPAYTVLALRVAQGLQESMQSTFTESLRSLDERFIAPAVGWLGAGGFGSVTLIGNDVALTVRRGSRWRRWRRSRGGLESFT